MSGAYLGEPRRREDPPEPERPAPPSLSETLARRRRKRTGEQPPAREPAAPSADNPSPGLDERVQRLLARRIDHSLEG